MYTKTQHDYNIRRLLKYWSGYFSYSTLQKINKMLVDDLNKNHNIKENIYKKVKHISDDGKFNAGRWNVDELY